MHQAEADARRRQDELRGEVRMLESRKRDAIERLREIAATLQGVLPREESSLARDLQPQPRG